MKCGKTLRATLFALTLLAPSATYAAEAGLITKSSNYTVAETIQRFEKAVTDRGWVVFTQIDHAAAAARVGLTMRPRTVLLFGNPKLGTTPMQRAPMLAIDNPPKALVWEDEQGKVSLTYNSAEYIGRYIYPRHGLTMPNDIMAAIEKVLDEFSDRATK